MKRVSEYIEANYQDQIRLSDIAEQENLTVTHLSHLISEQFGVSFQDYLKHKRLENAVRLIHTGRTLSEISEYCGFSELKYMTKAFKETFHMTPAEYRKKEEQIPSVSSLEDRSEYIYSDREALALLRQSFGDN
jgi:AraC-like DNA-binding protein